jgi:hypothetical protein
MQSNNVGADTFEKSTSTPEWLKKLVSPPSIQPHLLGDVFWSFNARSSAPSHVRKSAYDLSYLAFSLRKFILTRFDGSKAPAKQIVRDFDDIFQLRAAFISDYDHHCSDESLGPNRLEISLQQQLPCNSVAESLRPHFVVRDVLQDVISTHNHGLELFEKHTADFCQALLYDPVRVESEFPFEIREKLEKYGQPHLAYE